MRSLLAFILWLPLLIVPGPAPAPQSAGLPVCSQAVHDRYMAVGPDGVRYPTWHPQIDAYYHCAFDHEHGSDPALVLPGYKPLYGYSARGMPEGHPGFKGYAFSAGGYKWYITQHQGSSNAVKAACVQFHTLDVLAVDSTGQRVADVHLMADFGRAAANETYATLPTGCAQPTDSTGVREFSIVSLHNIGYEPWRVDKRDPWPGLRLQSITFNVLNPQTACADVTCTVALARQDPNVGPAIGTYRFLTLYPGFGIQATGAYSGTFSTDMHGAMPGDTQQYILPGLVALNGQTVALYPYNGQAMWYAPLVPGYDSMVFRLNPFVTGPN